MGAIYTISCDYDDRIYVGSTSKIDPFRRWEEHLAALRRGWHPSPDLMKVAAFHGIASMEFAVVEIVDDDNFLRAREQCWIGRNADRLLNASNDAWNYDRTGEKMPAAAVERLRTRMLGNQHRKGKPHPPEDKAKISAGLKKAHAEGRRKPSSPDIARANIDRYNSLIKADPSKKYTHPDTSERDAAVVARHAEIGSPAMVAKEFGLSQTTVGQIVKRLNPEQVGVSRRAHPHGKDGRFLKKER